MIHLKLLTISSLSLFSYAELEIPDQLKFPSIFAISNSTFPLVVSYKRKGDVDTLFKKDVSNYVLAEHESIKMPITIFPKSKSLCDGFNPNFYVKGAKDETEGLSERIGCISNQYCSSSKISREVYITKCSFRDEKSTNYKTRFENKRGRLYCPSEVTCALTLFINYPGEGYVENMFYLNKQSILLLIVEISVLYIISVNFYPRYLTLK